MELQIKEYTLPEVIDFNFDELKAEIQSKMERYSGLVYTEAQIPEAKKDIANLRKFIKALSDERIKVKKQCLKPYDEFEKKINELSAIVQDAIDNGDGQIKSFEDQRKAEKRGEIVAYWHEVLKADKIPAGITFDHLFNEKWLNASVKMSTVKAEFDAALEKIVADLETLKNLPEFGFEAAEVYRETLDINRAISEGKRLAEIQKKKEEATIKATVNVNVQTPEGKEYPMGKVDVEVPARQWVSFRALLNVDEAGKLKGFFDANGIIFEPLKVGDDE